MLVIMLILAVASLLLALCLLLGYRLLLGHHRVSDEEFHRIQTSPVSHYVPVEHLQQGDGSVTVAARGGLHGFSLMCVGTEWAYFYSGRTGRGGVLNHFGRKPRPGGYARIDITGADFSAAVPRVELRMRRWDSAIASKRSYTGPGSVTPVASPRLDRKLRAGGERKK